jgi:hypothetical protein
MFQLGMKTDMFLKIAIVSKCELQPGEEQKPGNRNTWRMIQQQQQQQQ